MTCQACPLHAFRRTVVYGRGPKEDVDIVIIGEAPGKAEDALGEAFVGEAGKLLDRMLRDAGLSAFRVFYTNTVLCHPTDRKGGTTRPPEPEEVAACGDNLRAILDLANPRAIVLAGDTAVKFFGRRFPHAHKIQHPAFLVKTGAEHSPYYLKNIRTLEVVRAKIEG